MLLPLYWGVAARLRSWLWWRVTSARHMLSCRSGTVDLCRWYQAADSIAYSCMHIGNTPISTRRSATSHSHWLRRFDLMCLCCHDNSKATPCFFFLHPTIPPPQQALELGQPCREVVEHHACEQPHLWSAWAGQIGGMLAKWSSSHLILDSIGRQNHLLNSQRSRVRAASVTGGKLPSLTLMSGCCFSQQWLHTPLVFYLDFNVDCKHGNK